MPDVRKMSEKDLFHHSMWTDRETGEIAVNEIWRRFEIMRDLCEAVEPMIESFGSTLEFRNPWEAEYCERKVLAYRAMKEEGNAD